MPPALFPLSTLHGPRFGMGQFSFAGLQFE